MNDEKDNTLDRRQFLGKASSGMFSVAAFAMGGVLISGANESAATPCIRPPGALDEEDFLATCIRCGRCGDACPNRAIVTFTEESGKDLAMKPGRGQRGTPVIFPRSQACMLCNQTPGENLLCTQACPSGALKLVAKGTESVVENVSMGLAEVDENLCYSYNGASCGVCVRACPLEGKALKAGLWEKPIIDPEFCVGCGLCERACVRYPQAIRVKPNAIQS